MGFQQLKIRFLHGCKKIVLTPERVIYTHITTPVLVKRLREKEKIKVLFVVFEVASWKTESLYNEMLAHPRFNPMLLVVPSKENKDEIRNVENYMQSRGYEYSELKEKETIQNKYHPDIIFYQKPYSWCIDQSLFFRKNLKSLFCYMSYCFRNTMMDFNQNTFFHNYAWQVYLENDSVKEEMKSIMDNGGRNTIVTGLTVMDDLMKDKSLIFDPWKPLVGRKRIIYAPHHTINHETINRSTFLLYGEFMLEMARKYKDSVQWAFKPHPLLKEKLFKVWGKQKTESYYREWEQMENSQIETGEYMGLFKHSDAMIHDSGSFILEYIYMHKPVMYLFSEESLNSVNKQTQEAIKVHSLGLNKNQVEQFIQDVVSGKDLRKHDRESFYANYLIPHGNSVCENVIDCILGTK